jgi:putative redox protein
MSRTVDCESEKAPAFRQVLRVGPFVFHADSAFSGGGGETAPGAHDYFDASLAACKALTALVYAKARAIPLERVEAHVERDDRKEREGVYGLKVRLKFHGALTDEQRTRLYNAVGHCPVHKLMTTTDVVIETVPL